MKYLFFFLTLLAFKCGDNDDIKNQDVEKKELETLAIEIKTLADSSVCSSEFACNFIGFGSKPCGGHWEYLVYSNSIDVADFLSKVKIYNELEKDYNIKYNIVSDCMFVMPPESTTCANGKCIAVNN
ncbi:MAG: hypothetical protein KAH67_02025 [Flavobacteriaceae bacterium]|nr:hypothetical protein [Flavobacteriaceae bacterium]